MVSAGWNSLVSFEFQPRDPHIQQGFIRCHQERTIFHEGLTFHGVVRLATALFPAHSRL